MCGCNKLLPLAGSPSPETVPVVSQYSLPLVLASSFKDGCCTPISLRGREAVSEPFLYEVELESQDRALELKSTVGTGMSVGVMRTGADSRWIDGVVTRFAQTPGTVRTAGYRAELRPWLWLLTLRADCRIFHAGTRLEGKNVLTAGGRVLCVTALGDSVKMARTRAYEAVDRIRFAGMQFRRDIGARALRKR